MSETKGGDLPSKIVGRRPFLITGTKVTVAAAAGAFIENEIERTEHWVKTSQGIFIPLYEMHDKGIDHLSIPSDINAFYRELAWPGGIMTVDAQDTLSSEYYPYGNQNNVRRVFPDDVLNRVSNAQADIIVGDTFIPEAEDKFSLMMWGEFGLGSIIAGIGKIQARLTRRSLLKSATVSAAGWLLSPVVSSGLKIAGYQTQVDAVKRIVARLEGIQSHLHPEIISVFFRNVLIADKLLIAAEELKVKNEKIPKIAFNIEAQHSGIEDFLLAGQDFCRQAILLFPKDFLRSVIDANNGVEDFSSARSIIFKGYNGNIQDLAITEDRKITDAKLVADLRNKLAI